MASHIINTFLNIKVIRKVRVKRSIKAISMIHGKIGMAYVQENLKEMKDTEEVK